MSDIPPILSDEKYLYCISLARLCRNDKRTGERYGSIIVKNDEIIGRGFNRAAVHFAFKLDRKIRQGWVNHAEIEALNDALSQGFDITDAELYTAGYFLSSGRLFLQKKYTCYRCPPIMERHGVDNIHIPTPDGWERKTLDVAMEEGREFKGNAYQKRLEHCIGDYKIGLIEDFLLEPDALGVS